jgi:hypothetical protein
MALHTEDVAGFEYGGVGDRVRAGGGGLLDDRHVIAVREINEWLRRQIVQDARRANGIECVPAHVRDARIDIEALHVSGEDAESALVRGFFTGFEESLESETDAEKRDAGVDTADECVADVHLIERAQHLAEVAHAGQDDFGGAFECGCIAHEFIGCADFVQRVLDGAEVACAVVEDRDHNNPFVEGSWSFSWASMEQA